MFPKYTPGLVSVIIPTFNSAQYLLQAINSALSQSYAKVEIVVVNDGSTDNTKEVITPYQDKILYFYKENGGPGSARNYGIERSNGEYIAFLDADDYWLPEKLKFQISYFKKHRNYALIHSNTLILEEDKELYPRYIHKQPLTGNIYKQLFLHNCINNLTVILKRECFDKVGGFDEDKTLIGLEDYDLWLRIAMQYEIGYVDEIVSVYRIHQKNITSESKAIKSQIFLLDKFKNADSENKKLPARIFIEKKKLVYFRWACHLIEKHNYNQAYEKFLIAASGKGLKIVSIIGALSCRLKTNFLTKSRVSSISLKRYGDYLVYTKKFKDAEKFYLESIKIFAVQKIAYKQLFHIYLKKMQLKRFDS